MDGLSQIQGGLLVKKAVQNAKLLVDYQNVLALIGTWGTPTNIGILNDVIQDKTVPIISPLTGSNVLYNNFDKRIILTRDSYKNEINTIDYQKLKKIYTLASKLKLYEPYIVDETIEDMRRLENAVKTNDESVFEELEE